MSSTGAESAHARVAAPTASYVNYVAPNVDGDSGLVSDAAVEAAAAYDRKFAGGNPVAAAQLAEYERVALATGVSPRDQRMVPPTDDAQVAKLLTVLVEFNEDAADDFSGVWVPRTVFGDRTCIERPEGTLRSGPLHNQIQNPAEYDHVDNNTVWVPDFSPEYYNDLLYSRAGVTERVRMDLAGPDGAAGIDISGYSLRKMYKHMSGSSYVIRGEAPPWVEVEHSEAWYGASTCSFQDGQWVAGSNQRNDGHPDNELGVRQLAIDAVDALAAANPDFPFHRYDREDVGDVDGDGDVLEPDGVIDHLVLVHAGKDKATFNAAEGTDAIWSHSSALVEQHEIPGAGGVAISNYIVMPENGGVGIFAHEYGHDLGLPDLYDSSGAASADIEFWDLMAVGSHPGPLYQTMPAQMGLWDKWVLGWAEPQTFAPGDEAQSVALGENTFQPAGTEDGVKVDLPPKVVTVAEPHSGEEMWWSESDQSWASNSLTRDVDVPAGDDVRFWLWSNYVIEDDWDFGFVELSTDGGASWSQPVVTAEDGTVVTTPDDYDDPNGMLETFGRTRGLTGSSDGWRHDFLDLTPYAGGTVQVRLSYATDSGFQARGWFADDFAVTADGTETWADDVEAGADGWSAEVGSWLPDQPLGAGWTIDTGTYTASQYYLAEWRNFHGFDRGLRYTYDTTYSANGPWYVERIKFNSRGLLVWYRDTTYGSLNHVTATTYDLPSVGSKGGLLLVDSHFDPLRRTGEAAEYDTSVQKNLASRPQTSNAAFGLHPTFRFDECLAEVAGQDPYTEFCTSFRRLPGVSRFSDDQTWYPGVELRGEPGSETFLFRDLDGSVVVPNGDNAPYSTRVTDVNGDPLPEWYGEDLGNGLVLGTGAPTRPLGVSFELESVGANSRSATVRVDPAD